MASVRIKFWGVRGSLITPGKDTVIYGGNTSCVEVESQDVRVVLDAGSGLVNYAKSLSSKIKSHFIFLSHYHYDHVCGLPFFEPLYDASAKVVLHAPLGPEHAPEALMQKLFRSEFFPVSFENLPAKIQIKPLQETNVALKPFRVKSFFVNHPGSTLGYEVSAAGKRVIYICDHEPAGSHDHIQKKNYEENLIEKIKGVDVLIHDAHFTDAEYEKHKGWGHSPWSYVLDLAHRAQVKELVFFHHAPHRKDKDLLAMEKKFKALVRKEKWPFALSFAREGKEIVLK